MKFRWDEDRMKWDTDRLKWDTTQFRDAPRTRYSSGNAGYHGPSYRRDRRYNDRRSYYYDDRPETIVRTRTRYINNRPIIYYEREEPKYHKPISKRGVRKVTIKVYILLIVLIIIAIAVVISKHMQ